MSRQPSSSGIPFGSIKGWITALVLAIGMIALALALYSARWILMSLLVGIGIGVIMIPAVDFMKRRLRVPRGLGTLVLVLVMLAALGGLGYLIVSLISDQLVPVVEKLIRSGDQYQARLAELLGRWEWLNRSIQRVNFSEFVRRTLEALMQGLQLSAAALGGLTFVLAIAAYLAVNPRQYLEGMLSLLPAYSRARWESVAHESARALRGWFGAQLISLSIVGALAAFGLWMLGIESWVVLGLITACCEVVPYVGPFTAGAVGIIVTLGSQPEMALWVAGLYTLVQQIEGNFITPMVLKERIELPPVTLLALMFFMGKFFGILGVLVTPGLFTVARRIYLLIHVPRMNALTVERVTQQALESDESMKEAG